MILRWSNKTIHDNCLIRHSGQLQNKVCKKVTSILIILMEIPREVKKSVSNSLILYSNITFLFRIKRGMNMLFLTVQSTPMGIVRQYKSNINTQIKIDIDFYPILRLIRSVANKRTPCERSLSRLVSLKPQFAYNCHNVNRTSETSASST